MKNSLGILKILSQSEKEIDDNKLSSQESVFSELDKKLSELKKIK